MDACGFGPRPGFPPTLPEVKYAIGDRDQTENMKDCRQFYIDGNWVDTIHVHDFPVINPATEEPIATISLGSLADVDHAVAAAKRAFESYSETNLSDRLRLLHSVIKAYQERMEEMAETISCEMGAPLGLSRAAQAPAGLAHLLEI